MDFRHIKPIEYNKKEYVAAPFEEINRVAQFHNANVEKAEAYQDAMVDFYQKNQSVGAGNEVLKQLGSDMDQYIASTDIYNPQSLGSTKKFARKFMSNPWFSYNRGEMEKVKAEDAVVANLRAHGLYSEVDDAKRKAKIYRDPDAIAKLQKLAERTGADYSEYINGWDGRSGTATTNPVALNRDTSAMVEHYNKNIKEEYVIQKRNGIDYEVPVVTQASVQKAQSGFVGELRNSEQGKRMLEEAMLLDPKLTPDQFFKEKAGIMSSKYQFASSDAKLGRYAVTGKGSYDMYQMKMVFDELDYQRKLKLAALKGKGAGKEQVDVGSRVTEVYNFTHSADPKVKAEYDKANLSLEKQKAAALAGGYSPSSMSLDEALGKVSSDPKLTESFNSNFFGANLSFGKVRDKSNVLDKIAGGAGAIAGAKIAANVTSKFGWAGKLVAAGLLGGAAYMTSRRVNTGTGSSVAASLVNSGVINPEMAMNVVTDIDNQIKQTGKKADELSESQRQDILGDVIRRTYSGENVTSGVFDNSWSQIYEPLNTNYKDMLKYYNGNETAANIQIEQNRLQLDMIAQDYVSKGVMPEQPAAQEHLNKVYKKYVQNMSGVHRYSIDGKTYTPELGKSLADVINEHVGDDPEAMSLYKAALKFSAWDVSTGGITMNTDFTNLRGDAAKRARDLGLKDITVSLKLDSNTEEDVKLIADIGKLDNRWYGEKWYSTKGVPDYFNDYRTTSEANGTDFTKVVDGLALKAEKDKNYTGRTRLITVPNGLIGEYITTPGLDVLKNKKDSGYLIKPIYAVQFEYKEPGSRDVKWMFSDNVKMNNGVWHSGYFTADEIYMQTLQSLNRDLNLPTKKGTVSAAQANATSAYEYESMVGDASPWDWQGE